MMELKFPLNITLDSPRPIFKAYINDVPLKCMLDTGADLPVFCKGSELFQELMKEKSGVSEYKGTFVGGFGKTAESTMLWSVDDFVFSDKSNAIVYKGIKLAVLNKPNIPCDLVLSASMFMKMKYTIDCSSRKHLLTIVADKSIYGVGFYDKKETIYIFTKDNQYCCGDVSDNGYDRVQ